MAKHIFLSNGDLSVGLDSNSQVSELYYPYITDGNLTGDQSIHHKIGLYCEGAVHWLDDGAWKIRQDYYPGRLIARTIADNRWLSIRLEIQDYVDSELNILSRNIHVVNLSGRKREVKLFLHQNFLIGHGHHAVDTVQYLPKSTLKGIDMPIIAHYQGTKTFLIAGQCCNSADGFREFSVGHFGKYGNSYMNGVWYDAADGALSGNRVETGHTDSIIGFAATLAPHDSMYANYYLAAGDSIPSAGRTLQRFLHEGVESRTKKTAAYWLERIQPAIDKIKLLPPKYRHTAIDAIISLRSCLATNGALMTADPATSTMSVQPAYAAFIAQTFMQLGLDNEAGKIYNFLSTVVDRDHCLLPSYLADGSRGVNNYSWPTDNSVWPLRIVDNAATLYSLCQSISIASTDRSLPTDWRRRWTKLGKPLADFLSDYVDPITKLPLPSYHYLDNELSTSARDAAMVYGGLCAAATIAEQVKDTDSIIKYQTVADDIRDNAGMLWSDAHITTEHLTDNYPGVKIATQLLVTDKGDPAKQCRLIDAYQKALGDNQPSLCPSYAALNDAPTNAAFIRACLNLINSRE